jgi:hypothetical protein
LAGVRVVAAVRVVVGGGADGGSGCGWWLGKGAVVVGGVGGGGVSGVGGMLWVGLSG